MKDKDQLLQDCTAYFYQHGFHGTAVDQIAEHANVTKRTLYRYFANKDALYLATLRYRHQQVMQLLEQTLANFSHEQTAQGYGVFLKNWLVSEQFFGCMFINACGEFSNISHPVHQLAYQHKQAILTLLQARLSQTDVENGDVLALQLFIRGEGLIVARQTGILTDNMIKSWDSDFLI